MDSMKNVVSMKNDEMCLHQPPLPNWIVTIPANGHFKVFYEKLNWWQRMGMRFIGWGVKRVEKR